MSVTLSGTTGLSLPSNGLSIGGQIVKVWTLDTLTGAVNIPSGTTAQRPSTPYAGYFRYNTTISGYEGHNGSSWITLAPTASPTLTGTTTLGSGGIAFSDATTQNTGGYTGFRNRIINGDMRIDQRNAGASVTLGTGNTYVVDRFACNSAQASKYSAQQNAGSVTPPVGFTKYFGITSLANTAIGASEYYDINQPIEGLNVADLAWGTINAKAVTLSFYVYSSLTGTFGGYFVNGAGTRWYTFSYTISSPNTWTYITLTIPGDTTGTYTYTTSQFGWMSWSLGANSSLLGTANAWANTASRGVTGQQNVVGTSGATFYLTGVQLEKGSVATPFEFRPYGMELALCQRYFESTRGSFRSVGSSGWTGGHCSFKVTKRAIPTMSLVSSGQASIGAFNAFLNIDAEGAGAQWANGGENYVYNFVSTASAEL